MKSIYTLVIFAATAAFSLIAFAPQPIIPQALAQTTSIATSTISTTEDVATTTASTVTAPITDITETTAPTVTPEQSPTSTIKTNYPYTLIIPKISVDAGVKAMGLENDGRMAVPNNFTEVAWFTGSSQPGQKGSAVLGAHVDNGAAIPGVFKNLNQLNKGDDIMVTASNGTTYHYKVTDTKLYNRNSQNTDAVFSGNIGASSLNIITCAGTWLPSEHTYSDRLVVFSQLVA